MPVKPAKLYTVFAGQDLDATARARSYFGEYQPSSPSVALLKDGEVVAFVHRHQIEGRHPDQIAAMLVQAFDSSLRVTGHVFHPGHDELHGVTVVVAGASGRTYVGRWHERGAVASPCATSPFMTRRATPSSLDAWLARQRKFGVAATEKHAGHSRRRSWRGAPVRSGVRRLDGRSTALSTCAVTVRRLTLSVPFLRDRLLEDHAVPAIAIDHVTKRSPGTPP